MVSLFILLLSACARSSFLIEKQNEHKMVGQEIQAGSFRLMTYARYQARKAPLVVYIEGDGHAWNNRSTPSADPTPYKPLALELALLDPAPNLAYLARPCQYVKDDPSCQNPHVWTSHRFALEVIDAMNKAVQILMDQADAEGVHLVGYSGGAAVAALLAERRLDVLSLRTIAGNLDTEALNKHHDVSPMSESLNPIDIALSIRTLPQQHWIGLQDEVVPPFIVERFIERMGRPPAAKVIPVAHCSHDKGWTTAYDPHLQPRQIWED